MCLWRDQFRVEELIASPRALARQLKLYKKAFGSKHWNNPDDYVQWLENDASLPQLDQFIDALLVISSCRVGLKSMAQQILWAIELRGLLPDRRLQMEFFYLPPFSLIQHLGMIARGVFGLISSAFTNMQPDIHWSGEEAPLGQQMSG